MHNKDQKNLKISKNFQKKKIRIKKNLVVIIGASGGIELRSQKNF